LRGDSESESAVVEESERRKSSIKEVKEHEKGTETDAPNNEALDVVMNEDREKGRLSLKIVHSSIQALGGYFAIASVQVAALVTGLLFLLSDYYMLKWVQDYNPYDRVGNFWFVFYLMMGRAVGSYARAFIIVLITLSASRKIHTGMVFALLHSKIGEFIERVPSGRILNRLTKDIDVIDRDLRGPMQQLFLSIAMVIFDFGIIVWATNSYLLIIPLLVFVFAGFRDQGRYTSTKSEFMRLNTISKSPIMEWFSSILKGISEVRVMGRVDFAREKMLNLIDENAKNNIMLYALDAWFATRIGIWNFLFVFIPSYGYQMYQVYRAGNGGSALNIKLVVLFVLNTTKFSTDVINLLNYLSSTEISLIAVERCTAFENIEAEAGYLHLQQDRERFLHPKSSSIKEIVKQSKSLLFPLGKVELSNLSARYITNKKDVLSNLTISVNPGEKIGIVGRTGAGKTSLIKLFWRCLEPYQGKILFDGKDIKDLDLKHLRSEVMVVSQENAIFQGTLRENLDPYLEYGGNSKSEEYLLQEQKLISILKRLNFSPDKLEEGLSFQVETDGNNLSLGEKQILSFVRAIVEHKRIMILDEATANIDLKTEKAIQELIEECFTDCTMFIIAHRIQTVLSCDRILVMSQGKVQEFDTVSNLLKNPKSEFAIIYERLKNNYE